MNTDNFGEPKSSPSNAPDVRAAAEPKAATPNPFYKRIYSTPITGGQVWVEIPAPGGVITCDDAEDLKDWLDLIQAQLQRIINQSR